MLNLTEKSAKYQPFVDFLNEFDVEVRDYSGRGMYGKRCVSVTTDKPLQEIICDILQVYNEMDMEEEFGELDIYQILRNTKSDSMGLDSVYYWPRIEVV